MVSNTNNFSEWLEGEKINIYSCDSREKGFLSRIYDRVNRSVALTTKQKDFLKGIKNKTEDNSVEDDLTVISLLKPLKKISKNRPYIWEKKVWMELNGKQLYHYLIDGHICFPLNEIAEFINKPLGTVKKAFDRAKQRFFLNINDDFFVKGKDYLEFRKDNYILRNESFINNKREKKLVFVTYLGLWKLFASFRDEYPIWVHHKLAEKEYYRIKHFTRESKIVPLNIGSKLGELYKKYGIFLETLGKIKSPIERWFYIYSWDKINGLESQYAIGNLHVDFAIPTIKLGIETDGREYHKTVYQINRDNKRDAFLHSEGWQVQRFTGNDIYNDVAGCVARVLKIIKNHFSDVE